jgi:hypothetical protein
VWIRRREEEVGLSGGGEERRRAGRTTGSCARLAGSGPALPDLCPPRRLTSKPREITCCGGWRRRRRSGRTVGQAGGGGRAVHGGGTAAPWMEGALTPSRDGGRCWGEEEGWSRTGFESGGEGGRGPAAGYGAPSRRRGQSPPPLLCSPGEGRGE